MNLNDEMLTVYKDEGGIIWQKIGLCPEPTNILKKLETGEILHIIPSSLLAEGFEKLIPESEVSDGNKY